MTVDDLKEAGPPGAGPHNQWLISTGPLYVANKLGKVSLAHPVRVIRMGNEFLDCYR